jgi:hypothetical protein
MREVIGLHLHAAAVDRRGVGQGHHAGVVAEDVEAAVAELTRLELRVQCVADAYLCASLLDRSNQLKAAVAGAENEMYVSRTR